MTNSISSQRLLTDIWHRGQLPASALEHVQLSGSDPVFASSFAVGAAAQTGIAAAALAACEVGHQRGQARRPVSVDMTHAALECTGWFSVDGRVPNIWDVFSGLYAAQDGWVRIHANFEHHREGALRLLGLNPQTATRADAEGAMRNWTALAFETAAARAGLVASAFRSFDEWDASEQGQAIAALPLLRIEKIGDAPPIPLPPLSPDARPLQGVRVLDLTRILAGPVCGRTLSNHGADVMLVNSPHLPNIESIADTSRGKWSCYADLKTTEGKSALLSMAKQAHVFVQGYRPGALDALGVGLRDLTKVRPGLVFVSLSAYANEGPWGQRRGFDSLVQTAMGFNYAEMHAAKKATPRPLPMPILDYATGHLMAFAVASALVRQQQEGGSWHVQLSLAQTGHWLRGLGRVPAAFTLPASDRAPFVETTSSGFGSLCAFRHSAVVGGYEPKTANGSTYRPSMPPGTHPPRWP